MELAKESWPECMTQHINADACKEFIDNEIFTLFTGADRYIKSFIKHKRNEADPWYNTVEVTMDDSNLVIGRDGDGIVHYPL